jgi:cell division septal protein FtsQ
MWFFKPERKRNRRLGRDHVLDVKLRNDQVRSNRIRFARNLFLICIAPFLGLYLLWRTGELLLVKFVYTNPDFAVENFPVQTDGIVAPEQLRRWSGVKLGDNIFALDTAVVKHRLEAFPVVKTVSVERSLPHTLKIVVTERDPIAQVDLVRPDLPGGVAAGVFQLAADGVVMPPLDPRYSILPPGRPNPPLPVVTGLNVDQLQMGRPVDLPQAQAALQLITAFDHSPMAGLVDLARLDVSAPGVVVLTTRQGSQITFALANLDGQLRRWRGIYDLGLKRNATIATADLAVENNVPVRWAVTGPVPDQPPKPAVRPVRNNNIRRRNV